MERAYVVTGTVVDGTTLQLDEALPQAAGVRVRVTIELAPSAERPRKMSLEEFTAQLRARQEARGHVPPTREEVDARIRELRGK